MDKLEEYVTKRDEIESELLKLCAEKGIRYGEVFAKFPVYKSEFEKNNTKGENILDWYFRRLDYEAQRAREYIRGYKKDERVWIPGDAV